MIAIDGVLKFLRDESELGIPQGEAEDGKLTD